MRTNQPVAAPRAKPAPTVNAVRGHHTSATVSNINRSIDSASTTFLSPSNNVFGSSSTASRSQPLSNRTNNSFNANNSTSDDSNPTVCNCGSPALMLTVRKDGANKGREFYTCGNNKACDFFLWKDGMSSNTASSGGSGGGGGGGGGGSGGGYSGGASANYNNQGQNRASNQTASNSNGGAAMCNCNEPAKQ